MRYSSNMDIPNEKAKLTVPKPTLIVEFCGKACKVIVNERNIRLEVAKTGKPMARATVALESVFGKDVADKADKALVLIKDYSENIGMLDMLVKNNIVKHIKQTPQIGHVTFELCKLNPHLVN